jgi:ubiquinone/menaquinone biosynthesis C-methylase UbiE
MNERTFRPHDAHKLEDPERLVWLPPDEIISHLHIKAGSTIADIGAGTGYFTIPIAKAVGDAGKVFAVDFQKEMLAHIQKKLAGSGSPANIVLVQGDASHTGLAKKSCDLVFMANLWHELDDHLEVLKESASILHADGILAIIDWRSDLSAPPGPPSEHRISDQEVQNTLRHSDWSILKAITVGRFSHLILAAKR